MNQMDLQGRIIIYKDNFKKVLFNLSTQLIIFPFLLECSNYLNFNFTTIHSLTLYNHFFNVLWCECNAALNNDNKSINLTLDSSKSSSSSSR